MNSERKVVTKNGGNGVVCGCIAINVNHKKFSTKEAPDAVVNRIGEKISLLR